MNERNNKSKRLDAYSLFINKIKTHSQISSNGMNGMFNNNNTIASSSKATNNNDGTDLVTNIHTDVTDFTKNEQSNTSLLAQHDPIHFKKYSKDYFTPRQIYLWVKVLE